MRSTKETPPVTGGLDKGPHASARFKGKNESELYFREII
jgi:hypothetical protein